MIVVCDAGLPSLPISCVALVPPLSRLYNGDHIVTDLTKLKGYKV